MAFTDLNTINQALRILGEDPIAAYPDASGTTRGDLVNEIYETTRDSTMSAREWPFALKRVKLFAFSTPSATLTPGATSGTGVTFTASVAVFSAGDVGKILRGSPTASPPVIGKATIVSFTDTTHVVADITEPFASTSAIPAGDWRLYLAPPPFGFSWTITVPGDRLTIRSVKATPTTEPPLIDETMFALEGTSILSNFDTIYVQYIRKETDTSVWNAHFVEALVAHLTSKFAEGITGQLEKATYYAKVYDRLLNFAFSAYRVESHDTEDVRAPLVDARYMSDARAAGNPLVQDR